MLNDTLNWRCRISEDSYAGDTGLFNLIFLVGICSRFSALHVFSPSVFNPHNKLVMDGFLDKERLRESHRDAQLHIQFKLAEQTQIQLLRFLLYCVISYHLWMSTGISVNTIQCVLRDIIVCIEWNGILTAILDTALACNCLIFISRPIQLRKKLTWYLHYCHQQTVI